MFQFLLFFAAFLSDINGQTTPVQNCTANPGDLPINAYIDGCTSFPCLLYQQENTFINMIFEAPRTLSSMRTLATAYLALGPTIVPVPYPLGDDAETCNFLTNTYCPVLAGEVVAYTLTMFIEDFMLVGTSANLEFRIVDEDREPLICIRVAILVMPPRLTNERQEQKLIT